MWVTGINLHPTGIKPLYLPELEAETEEVLLYIETAEHGHNSGRGREACDLRNRLAHHMLTHMLWQSMRFLSKLIRYAKSRGLLAARAGSLLRTHAHARARSLARAHSRTHDPPAQSPCSCSRCVVHQLIFKCATARTSLPGTGAGLARPSDLLRQQG